MSRNWKIVIVAFGAIVLTCVRVSLKMPEEAQAEETGHAQRLLQNTANQIVNNIWYVKDPRTNLCFAYCYYLDGMALATVPCEAIPPHLLTVAAVK